MTLDCIKPYTDDGYNPSWVAGTFIPWEIGVVVPENGEKMLCRTPLELTVVLKFDSL